VRDIKKWISIRFISKMLLLPFLIVSSGVFSFLLISAYFFERDGGLQYLQKIKGYEDNRRWQAAWVFSLQKSKDPKIVDELINLLSKNKDEKIQMFAALALGKMQNKKASPFLIKALFSKKRELKICSILALGNLKEKRAQSCLINLSKERDEGIKKVSAWALEMIKR